MGALALVQHPSGWRLLLDLLFAAMSGGLFVVPLYAIMQSKSEPDHRARTIASNNVVNALFMVAASVATAGLLAAGTLVATYITLEAPLPAARS